MGRRLLESTGRREERASERIRGAGPSLGLRFTSASALDRSMVSVLHIPVTTSSTPLQDAEGNILYNPDYSAAGGGHIGAPG